MPNFCIRIVNKDFSASNETELRDDEAARKDALKGALEIAIEEVCGGIPFFAAEVVVERDGSAINRFLIAVGASPLG
jgi:hypothetical protein